MTTDDGCDSIWNARLSGRNLLLLFDDDSCVCVFLVVNCKQENLTDSAAGLVWIIIMISSLPPTDQKHTRENWEPTFICVFLVAGERWGQHLLWPGGWLLSGVRLFVIVRDKKVPTARHSSVTFDQHNLALKGRGVCVWIVSRSQ